MLKNTIITLVLLFTTYSEAGRVLTVSGGGSIGEYRVNSKNRQYINTPRIFGQTTITFVVDSSSTATRNVDYKVNKLTCTIGQGAGNCFIWIKPIYVPGCDKPNGKTLVLRAVSMTPVLGWSSVSGKATFTFKDANC